MIRRLSPCLHRDGVEQSRRARGWCCYGNHARVIRLVGHILPHLILVIGRAGRPSSNSTSTLASASRSVGSTSKSSVYVRQRGQEKAG